MTTLLVLMILGSALLHAAWNFFAKRSGGNLIVMWTGTALSFMVTLPFALFLIREESVTPIAAILIVSSGVVPPKSTLKTPSSTVTAGWFSSQTGVPFLYSLNVMLTDGVSMAAPFESVNLP